MPNWTGSWSGGRTYQTRDGRTVWVLRKMVDGRRYQIVLVGLETKAQAVRGLARSEDDPAEYRAPAARREVARQAASAEEARRAELEAQKRREDDALALYLDEVTIGRFLNRQRRCAGFRRCAAPLTCPGSWSHRLRGSHRSER